MFCPVCGKQVETPMEFQGAKVCPECGCVMEAPVKTPYWEKPIEPVSEERIEREKKQGIAVVLVYCLIMFFLCFFVVLFK